MLRTSVRYLCSAIGGRKVQPNEPIFQIYCTIMKRTALCLALLAACSKSETAAPSSAAPAAAPAAPAPAAPAQKPDDPAKALEQLGNALAQKPGGKPGEAVKAVNWRELTPLLSDEVAGWK